MNEAAASGPSPGRVAGLSLRGPARLHSDERLARRATRGDRRAFEEIFRRYHQDLYRFCLATVSNPQDAQEALQNTMVKVMRALPGEQREIKLKPWLFRIARNEAVETMRKRRDTVELGTDRIASPWEIADAAASRERLRELFADLSELPERQRSALVMRELAGFDFEEIGETFGTSAAVARQTLYEARQSLRQMDEGREMSCATVRQTISDADGRVTRRRDVRAHLRDCAGCRAFRDDIGRRRENFAAVMPLPAAVSTSLLQGLLSGEATGAALAASAGGAASGGVGGAVGVGAGKAVAGSVLLKSAATVAVVATVGAGAADRGGLIDLPRPGGDSGAATRASDDGAKGARNAPGASAAAPGASEGRATQGDGASAARRDGVGLSPGSAPGHETDGRRTHPAQKGQARPPHAGKPSHASQGQPKGKPSRPDSAGGGRPVEPPPRVENGQGPAPAQKPTETSSAGKGAAPSEQVAPPPVAPPATDGGPPAPPSAEGASSRSKPSGQESTPGNPASGEQAVEEAASDPEV